MKRVLCTNLLFASLVGCGDVGETPEEMTIGAQSSFLTADDGISTEALRTRREFSFTKVAAFGENTPSGEQFKSYFVPHGLNDQGDTFFQSDTASGAHLFRLRAHQPAEQFAGKGQPAPGGGLYTDGVMSIGTAMNQDGDAVFKYLLDVAETESLPTGRHQGVFRVDAGRRPITLVRPGVTLAPNGQPFLGTHMYSGINRSRDVVFSGIIQTSKGIKAPPEPDPSA